MTRVTRLRVAARGVARPPRTEGGSASIYAVVVLLALSVICVIATQCVAVARIQHKSASAADLAALAASQAVLDGGDGCAAADEVATKNHAELRSCELAEAAATVTVAIDTPSIWGATWAVKGRARAAPADYQSTQ